MTCHFKSKIWKILNIFSAAPSPAQLPGGGREPRRQETLWWPALQLQQAGEAGGQHHRDSHRPPQTQALPADCRGESVIVRKRICYLIHGSCLGILSKLTSGRFDSKSRLIQKFSDKIINFWMQSQKINDSKHSKCFCCISNVVGFLILISDQKKQLLNFSAPLRIISFSGSNLSHNLHTKFDLLYSTSHLLFNLWS